MNKLTKIAAASVVAMGFGLGMTGQAQANAYALAWDNITNFGINIPGFVNASTTSTSASSKTGFRLKATAIRSMHCSHTVALRHVPQRTADPRAKLATTGEAMP